MRVLEEFTIEVIKRCNSDCIFCSSYSCKDDTYEIPLLDLKRIIYSALELGCKTICLSGGEPFLKNDLQKVIDYILELGLNTRIYTSGNADLGWFLSMAKKKPSILEQIDIIINYPTYKASSFSKLVKDETFSVADLDNLITDLIKLGITLEVHTVPNKINANELFDTTKHLKSLGVKKVSFLRLVAQGRASENKHILLIDNQKLALIINRINEILCDAEFQLRTGVPFSSLLENSSRCSAGINKLIIRWDGTVFPCEAFKEAPGNKRFILGSVYEDNIEDIWVKSIRNENLRDIRMLSERNCDSCPAQYLY